MELNKRKKIDEEKNKESWNQTKQKIQASIERNKKLYIENRSREYNKGFTEAKHNAQIETAKNMLNKGLDIELISQCTGLTIGELKSLR